MNFALNNLKWITLLVIIAASITTAIKHDITQNPPYGDQTSHTLQALSIAYDFDLKFDENDEKHWNDLGWYKHPDGLFFQKYSGGYAFSKPYAYSLYIAPFVATFDKNGFIIGNLSILLLLGLFIYLTLKKHYSENISIGLSIAFCLFSYVYMYIYTVHSDLFLALLVAIFSYIVATILDNKDHYLYFLLPVLIAFIVVDKITMLLVVAPITIYILISRPFKDIAIFAAIFMISFLVFIMPYLYYSDFTSWNPYSGERYYAAHSPPFFENYDVNGIAPASGKHHFSIINLLVNIFDVSELKNKLLSTYYYVFGAYTGILVFLPLSFIVIFITVRENIKKFDIRTTLVLSGIVLYISFYIALFPFNYYGGTWSLGNRYFLQISPIVILLLYMLNLDKRKCQLIITSSLLLTMMFIPHHHSRPSSAYTNIYRSGYFQRMMPFEKTQTVLTPYFPSNQDVNLSLLPQTPSYYKTKTDSYLYDNNIGEIVKYKDDFINKDISLFRYIKLNDSKILVDQSYHDNEKTHIWSKKESNLLIPNKGQIVYLTITSYLPLNNISITDNMSTKNYLLNNAVTISYDLKHFDKNWLIINFSAEKSEKPSNRNSKSHDSRDLSFNISLHEAN